MRRTRIDEAALITSAGESPDDEFARRRKKYAIMMGIRAICVVAAASTYQVSIYLALGFIVGGIVLPWCAVIIANDVAPKKRRPAPGMRPGYGQERMLTAGEESRTVDG